MTVSFTDLLGEAWARTEGARWLALVPLVHALLQTARIRQVLTDPSDFRIGLTLPFPAPVVDVWAFTSQAGSGVTVATPEPPFLFAIPVVVVVEALLAATFVGGLDAVFRGESPDVTAILRQYAVPFLGYTALSAALLLGFVGVVLGGFFGGPGPGIVLFIVAFPVLFVLGYLFYATPFLVVIEDRSLVAAFRRSLDLASDGGDYAYFFLAHLGVGLVASIPVSLLVHNVPVVGIPAGAVVGAGLGLAFTGATLLFLRRHVGRGDALADRPGASDSAQTTPDPSGGMQDLS